MKKYISIAALLTVGTTFANAGTYEDSCYNGLNAGNVIAYWSFDNASLTPEFCYTAVDVTAPTWTVGHSVSASTTGGWENGAYVSFTGNGGPYATLPKSNNGATNEGNATYSFFVKLSESSTGTILSFSGGFNVNANGTNIDFSYNNSTASYDLSSFANEWVNVTFISNHAAGADVYINGEAKNKATSFGLSGQGLGAQVGSNYANAGTGGKLNNTSVDEVVMWLGAKPTAEQIKSYAIPEPSAFGLLAGLGALALVGTRRRRK